MDPNGMMKKLVGGVIQSAERGSRKLFNIVQTPIESGSTAFRDFFQMLSSNGAAEDDEDLQDDTPAPMPNVAMVALSDATFPEDSRIVQSLKMVWPDGPEVSSITRDKTVLHFRIGAATAVIGYVPSPIVEADLETLWDMAWYWPEAQDQMQYHRAHLMVGFESKSDNRLAAAMALTKIVAALIQAQEEAVGVYWEAGPVVQPPPLFLQYAQSMTPEALPLMLWVNFGFCPERDNRVTLVTSGLRALGAREVEIPSSSHGQEVLWNTAYQFAHYILASGVEPEDGTVLGEPPGQIRVRLATSVLSKGQTVYRLEF